MSTENIVSGRKYRILSDAAQQIWDRISFWNKAADTEANDGIDLETKVGAINGITDDLTCEDPSIAASSVAVKTLNDSLQSVLVGVIPENTSHINFEKEFETIPFLIVMPRITSDPIGNVVFEHFQYSSLTTTGFDVISYTITSRQYIAVGKLKK